MNAANEPEESATGHVPGVTIEDLPPVHPRCRILNLCKIQERISRLRAAGDVTEADMLRDATLRALNFPMAG